MSARPWPSGSHRMHASSDMRNAVAANTAITSASRRCWNDRPAQARESRELTVGEDLVRGAGRPQPGHRVGDLLLGRQPPEELLQRPELVAGVRGTVPLQQPDDPHRGSALSCPLTARQASLDATDRSVAPLLFKGFRRWAPARPVYRPDSQPVTGLPGNYPDRTCTGRRRRASDQVMTWRITS